MRSLAVAALMLLTVFGTAQASRARDTLVSPSGHGTAVKILDIVSLNGTGRRGLLVAVDRRSSR